MNARSERAKAIRDYILRQVEEYPSEITSVAAREFGVSRQSVSRHLRTLVKQGFLIGTGKTRNREFRLKPIVEVGFALNVSGLQEDAVWRERILPHLETVPSNVLGICDYGFTEMLNNVIDHSESAQVFVHLTRYADSTSLLIKDLGVGIFNNIQSKLGLDDPRHALLELSKGKLTTNPNSHTGQGVFFTSKMFDSFSVLSGEIGFAQTFERDGWVIDTPKGSYVEGTVVSMEIRDEAKQTIRQIFDKFALGGDDFFFNRTHVGIKLAKYESENLISRSQAKRILARVDQFEEVILDFQDISTIGPSFADEIFRVFPEQHPTTALVPINTTPQVEQAIQHVRLGFSRVASEKRNAPKMLPPMSSRRNATLSKSRFTAGLQCLKRLYLESYHRDLADPVAESQQYRFDTGNEVGELARRRFPGGRLIEETHLQHDRAVATTKSLLSADTVPPLYEAAFTFEGIRMRADILRKSVGDAFDVIEVKSTTGVREAYILDVAIQLYVLEGAGLPLDRAYLMHLNNQYVYQGGDYDLDQLFSLADVNDDAWRFVEESVPGDLARMWDALQQNTPPDIEIGPHCTKPYQCPFYGHCHQAIPERPAASTGEPTIGPNLASLLRGANHPVSFLDFETIMPALPLYAGTRPYQTIPFQWSLHVQDTGGGLDHREFLNDDAADPRERLITSLLAAVPTAGSIVVYSSYESRMLNELAQAFPQYDHPLLALRERLFDLLPIIRGNYKHPALPNNSLKSVLPVLAPGCGYNDLEIQEGALASVSYLRMIAADTPAEEKARIRQNLLAYCARDTEATVKVLDALRAAAGA